jgi:hypothetical protein
MAWVQVLHNDDGGWEISWQGRENMTQGPQTAGRGCQGNDVKGGMGKAARMSV